MTRGTQRRSRPASSLAVLLLSVVVAACSGGGSTGGATPTASQGQAPVSTPASPGASPDAALVTRLEAAGADDGDAAILALTSTEVTDTAPRRAHVVQHLPTGDTVAYDIHVEPTTDAPGLISLETTTDPDRVTAHLVYVVDGSGAPPDVVDAIEAMGLDGRVAALAAAPPPPRTADVDAVSVAVEWSISKASDELRDQSLEALIEKLAPGKALSTMPVIKAGFAAKEGMELNAALDAMLVELDRLRDCAENPTNELTKKLYREQPGERDRILNEIAAVRADLIANTMVMELGVLNEFAADFGPKWLGFVTGPGTAWSKATLQDVNQQRLDALQRGIPKCDDECAGAGAGGSSGGASGGGSGGSSGGGSGGSGGSSGSACQFPITISGTVELDVRYDGELMATGRAAGVRWRVAPDGMGPASTLYVLEAGRYTWTFDGPWGEDSCGKGRLTGSGSDDLVPNEQPEGGGESGPGLPGENAMFNIMWANDYQPESTYLGLAKVRLHGDFVLTSGCGDVSGGDANWPPVISLNQWFATTLDPFPTYAQTMTGTYTTRAGVTEFIYRWDLSAGS